MLGFTFLTVSPAWGRASSVNVKPYVGGLPKLYRVAPDLYVSNVAAWRKLPSSVHQLVLARLRLQIKRLASLSRHGKLHLPRPKLRLPGSKLRKAKGRHNATPTRRDVRASDVSGASDYFPPFTSYSLWQPDASDTPCVSVQSDQAISAQVVAPLPVGIVLPVITCASEAPIPIDWAKTETGASVAAEVVDGAVQHAQSGVNLVASWTVPGSVTVPVTATITYTGIPFTFGFALGSCDESEVVVAGFIGGVLSEDRQEWKPTTCLGSFSTQLPIPEVQAIQGFVSIAKDTYAIAQDVTNPMVDGCQQLDTVLNLGQFAQDLASVLPTLDLPMAPGLSAQCQSTTFVWHSSGPLPGGTEVDFVVEPAVEAAEVGGVAVDALMGAATICVQAGSTPCEDTTTSLTSSQSPAFPGEQVVYRATVAPTPGGGSLSFSDNGAPIPNCVAVPLNAATGEASCSTTYSPTETGTHAITATYSGFGAFAPSSSRAFSETVQQPCSNVPAITGVTPGMLAASPTQTITIAGSCLGVQKPFNGDSPFIQLAIKNAKGEDQWNAGNSGALPAGSCTVSSDGDWVTLNVPRWTETEIVISELTGSYGTSFFWNWTLEPGDEVELEIWNPQSSRGPSCYTATVG